MPTTARRLPPCPTGCGVTPTSARPGGLCYTCATRPSTRRYTGSTLARTGPAYDPAAAVAGDELSAEDLFGDLEVTGDGEPVEVAYIGMFSTTTATLIGGVLDRDAHDALTRGQCHALALALHEATGWPIGAVVKTNHETTLRAGRALDPAWDGADHLFCYAPSTVGGIRVIDAGGVRDLKDMLRDCGTGTEDELHILTLDAETVAGYHHHGGMLEPNLPFARSVVPTLLTDGDLDPTEEVTAPEDFHKVRRTIEQVRDQMRREADRLASGESTQLAFKRESLDSLTGTEADLMVRLKRQEDSRLGRANFEEWDDEDFDLTREQVLDQLTNVRVKLKRTSREIAALTAMPPAGLRHYDSVYIHEGPHDHGLIVPATHARVADDAPAPDWTRSVAVRLPDGTTTVLPTSAVSTD